MKRIISTLTAAGLLAGALLLPAPMRAEDGPEGVRKETFQERMREKFGISEEQAGKLKAARRARREASAAARAEMGSAMRKLSDQIEDKADEKEIAATLDKLTALRKARRAEAEKFEAGLNAILTPTQRAKMMIAMKRHGGMKRRGGGMRRHEGR